MACLLIMTSEVGAYGQDDTSSGGEHADVSSEENPAPSDSEILETTEEMNEYTLEKLIVYNEVNHDEDVKLLSAIIKLLFVLIVCVLILTGAYIAKSVIDSMPRG